MNNHRKTPVRTVRSYYDYLKGLVKTTGPSYNTLLDLIYSTAFYEIIPNDSNRADDGLLLRDEFGFPQSTTQIPSNLLEVMIGLSRRINDMLYDPSDPDRYVYWFWLMVGNLGLLDYTDETISEEDVMVIKDILAVVVERSYEACGLGGLFPLAYPETDQRDVELWYQMMRFIAEFDT